MVGAKIGEGKTANLEREGREKTAEVTGKMKLDLEKEKERVSLRS